MINKPLDRPTEFDGFRVYRYDEVESTNDILIQEGIAGAKSGTAVIARRQTAGKGSKGRSFYSPPSGLYLSVLIRPGARVNASVAGNLPAICPPLSSEEAMLITPAVACAVADALTAASGKRLEIKWVNDIYRAGKKICGILTESCVDGCGDRFYVIGIGVNLFPPREGFPEEFADNVTTLFDREPNRNLKAHLPFTILGYINRRLYQIPGRKFLSDYRKRSNLIDRTVIVTPLDGSEPYKATAREIDQDARLVVEKESGEMITLNSEDVKLVINRPSPSKPLMFDLSDRLNS